MAIKNSYEQIAFPGLEAIVTDAMNSAITDNATLSAVQVNLSSSGDIQAIKDAITTISESTGNLATAEPEPTFAFWDNYNNQPYHSIYGSDFEYISSGSSNTSWDKYSNYTGQNYTNGSIGSGSNTTYSIQGCNYTSADGHMYMRPNSGQYGGGAVYKDGMSTYYRHWGVVIGNEGKRQKISLYQSGPTIRIMPRGQTSHFDTINMSGSQYSSWFGGTNYGMVAYNERTGTLVSMEAKDTANNYRMHIWKNTGRVLNSTNYKTGTLHLFLTEAKAQTSPNPDAQVSYNYYDFQWQANSSQSYAESQYRMRIIPGDNGVIGMSRMVPSNGIYYATYTPSSSTLITSYNSLGSSTTYGTEQGTEFGMRHEITWDNNTIATYAPYYYYSSGINVFFLDVRDPRNYTLGQVGDSSYGCQIVPFKKDKFLLGYSAYNSDSTGFAPCVIDAAATFEGRSYGGAFTNGGNLSLTALREVYRFSGRYTSTNYPVLLPMPHWKTTK